MRFAESATFRGSWDLANGTIGPTRSAESATFRCSWDFPNGTIGRVLCLVLHFDGVLSFWTLESFVRSLLVYSSSPLSDSLSYTF